MTRKQVEKLGYQKPVMLYSNLLLSALQGAHAKISSSIHNCAIFPTEDQSMICDRLKLTFSTNPKGGMGMEIMSQYLRFFMESDQELQSLEGSFQTKKN